MRSAKVVLSTLAVAALGLAGCGGKSLSGTYEADARLLPGKTGSTQPGYSLEAVRNKLQTSYERTLTLNNDGTYLETFGKGTNRGQWRSEGDKLILRSTETNGIQVLQQLQSDKNYRLTNGGKEIITDEFAAYGLETFFVRK